MSKILHILENSALCNLLEKNCNENFHPIFSGDFHTIFDAVLDDFGENPFLQKKAIDKIISITEKLETYYDAFQVRYPNLRGFP